MATLNPCIIRHEIYFWTCIKFQNTEFFLRGGPAVRSGWEKCLHLQDAGTELDVTGR